MESAILISAQGRTVNEGLSVGDVEGVIDDRNSGHSIIAFDKVFRRMGRYVSRLKVPCSGTVGGVGGGYSDAGDTAGGYLGD